VLLIALSTSLLVLAKPSGRAAADPSTPTDMLASVAVSCNSDGTANQVRVSLTGFNAAPAAGPVPVELQLVPNGQTTISSTLGPGINTPTYVTANSPSTVVWLAGTVTSTAPNTTADQSVIIQAANYGPSTPLAVPANCDQTLTPPILSTDLGLAALPSASVTTAVCNTAADGSTDGTATLTMSVPDPDPTDPTSTAAYTAASGMNEVDYGVFVTDASGTILAPTGLAMAQFDLSGNALNTPMLVIPAAGQTDDQLWVVGTDGQASATGQALAPLPDCPVTGPTTAPVVPPPVVVASSASDPATLNPPTSSPPVSTSQTVSNSDPPTPSSSPPTSTPTPSQTDTPTQNPEPVSVPVSPQPTEQPVTSTTSYNQVMLTSPPTLPTSSSVVAVQPTLTFPSEPSELQSSASASAAPLTANPTSTVSLAAGGKLAPPSTGPLADATSTIKPVQLLRWHQDAALVVGFDALAVFSLVGATVWSARRR
jgi:hypothetical protein